jgi:hypothetical protein
MKSFNAVRGTRKPSICPPPDIPKKKKNLREMKYAKYIYTVKLV